MKPVIIYTDTYDEKNNTVTLDKDKFESIIDQVYQSGLDDGRKVNQGLYYPNGVRGINPNDFKPDWTVRPEHLPVYETGKGIISETTITC